MPNEYTSFIEENKEILKFINKHNLKDKIKIADDEAKKYSLLEGNQYLHSYRYSKIYDLINDKFNNNLPNKSKYIFKIIDLLENKFNKNIDTIIKDYILNNNTYNIRIWVDEYDRNNGFVTQDDKTFYNINDAISYARKNFEKYEYASLEIIDNNNKLYFFKDNETEELYIEDRKIIYTSKEILNKYISNWNHKKELPIKDDLLYTKDNNKYIAIDNTSNNCWVEEFALENDCINWLLGKELEEDKGISYE